VSPQSRMKLAALLAAALSSPSGWMASAQTPSPASQAPLSKAAVGVELSIRFFDKRIYFPESDIPIKITIANNSGQSFRFKLADDRVHSLRFEARTPANRLLDPSDSYRLAMSDSRPMFYRELSLEPGEEYSFVESLGRYVRVEGPGSYFVAASLRPELEAKAPELQSNALALSIRPSPGLPPASDAIGAETGEILKAQAFPPDEVVRRTLAARQRELWNEFFLYIDLESLLSRNEEQKRAYDRQSDEGRRRMLERYRSDLQAKVVDQDIVVVPYYVEVLETRYTPSRGIVRVLEKFESQQLRLVKEYSYELERRDGIWYIVGYTVLNKGSE